MRRNIVMDSDIGISTSRPILEKIMIGPGIAEVYMARAWVPIMFRMAVRRIVRLKVLVLASTLKLLVPNEQPRRRIRQQPSVCPSCFVTWWSSFKSDYLFGRAILRGK